MLRLRETLILRKLIRTRTEGILSLSAQFGVSERSIRYDLSRIDEELRSEGLGRLDYDRGHALLVLVSDEREALKFLSHHQATHQERADELCIMMALEGSLNLTHFAAARALSRSTVKNDMERIRPLLEQRGLHCRSDGVHGIKLEGDEASIRFLVLSAFARTTRGAVQACIESLGISSLQPRIENLLLSLEGELGESFSDQGFRNTCDYLIIAAMRLSKGCTLSSGQGTEAVRQSREYAIVRQAASRFEMALDRPFPEAEQLQLAAFLSTSLSYNPSLNFMDDWLGIELLLKEALAVLEVRTGLPFAMSARELDRLVNYVKTIIYRSRNGLDSSRPGILEDAQGSGFLEDVRDALNVIERGAGLRFAKDDVYFLTLFLAKVRDDALPDLEEGKNALLVCPFGVENCDKVADDVREFFTVRFVDIIPVYKLRYKASEGIDIIITTIDLDFDTPIPIVKVQPLLTLEDIIRLRDRGLMRRHGRRIDFDEAFEDREQGYSSLAVDIAERIPGLFPQNVDQSRILDFLRVGRIVFADSFDSWEDAVRASALPLLTEGSMGEDYLEAVIAETAQGSRFMFFAPALAIPHAVPKRSISRTDMCLLVIRGAPVTFPCGKAASLILFFCAKRHSSHIDAIYDLLRRVQEETFLLRARAATDAAEILSLLGEAP